MMMIARSVAMATALLLTLTLVANSDGSPLTERGADEEQDLEEAPIEEEQRAMREAQEDPDIYEEGEEEKREEEEMEASNPDEVHAKRSWRTPIPDGDDDDDDDDRKGVIRRCRCVRCRRPPCKCVCWQYRQ